MTNVESKKAQRALVTGASSGIGLAVAEALVKAGHEVHAVALPGSGVEARARDMGATAHALDVTATAEAVALVERIAPHILVNNAGILGAFRDLQDTPHADLDRLIATNLSQIVHCTRAALPAMIARRSGHVFFLGSIAGRVAGRGLSTYAATKAAILAFAEGLRWDVLGTGVRTTVLVPGRVETHIYDRHFGGHDAARKALYTGILPIQPADMARAVLFALDMPDNVDVTVMEIMPTGQVFGGSKTAEPTMQAR